MDVLLQRFHEETGTSRETTVTVDQCCPTFLCTRAQFTDAYGGAGATTLLLPPPPPLNTYYYYYYYYYYY
jgi:hypothetical protein